MSSVNTNPGYNADYSSGKKNTSDLGFIYTDTNAIFFLIIGTAAVALMKTQVAFSMNKMEATSLSRQYKCLKSSYITSTAFTSIFFGISCSF